MTLSGSALFAIGSCTASSATVTTSPTDWAADNGVCVLHGGAACTLASPTLTGDGGSAHTYRLLALDGKGGYSVSAQISSDTSPTWALVSGATGYGLYRDGVLYGILSNRSTSDDRVTPGKYTWTSAAQYPNGAIVVASGRTYRCTRSNWDSLSGNSAPTWPSTLSASVTDNQLTWTHEYVGVPAAEPTTGASRHLVTTVASVGGSDITLADPVNVTGTLYLAHDDTAALQALIDASDGYTRLPNGVYRVWQLDQTDPILDLSAQPIEIHLCPGAEVRFHITSLPCGTANAVTPTYSVDLSDADLTILRGGRWSMHAMAAEPQPTDAAFCDVFFAECPATWRLRWDTEISGWPRVAGIYGDDGVRGRVGATDLSGLHVRNYGGSGHSSAFYHHGQLTYVGGQIRSLEDKSSHGLYSGPDDWGSTVVGVRFEGIGKNGINWYTASSPTATGEMHSRVLGCTFSGCQDNAVLVQTEGGSMSSVAVVACGFFGNNFGVKFGKGADSCVAAANTISAQLTGVGAITNRGTVVVGNAFHECTGSGATIDATSANSLTIVGNSWTWRTAATTTRVLQTAGGDGALFGCNNVDGWYYSYPLYLPTGDAPAIIGNVFRTDLPANANGPAIGGMSGAGVTNALVALNLMRSSVSGHDKSFFLRGDSNRFFTGISSGSLEQAAETNTNFEMLTQEPNAVDAGVAEARRRSRVQVRDASAIVTFQDLWDILDTIAEYT